MSVFDFDDFGADTIISDQCQSHDCRKELDKLHYANMNFKVTLFAIPAQMTYELLEWCDKNRGWVELAVHGFYHSSNYECSDWTYDDMAEHMAKIEGNVFVKGFKAPGWQISEGCYNWLNENGWWVADQAYNNHRRPDGIPAYVNQDGNFFSIVVDEVNPVEAWHGHTWNCVGNGIEETFDHVKDLVENATEFKFVSEVL